MKPNESDLDYLRRLRGQLIIAQTGLQALKGVYKELDKKFDSLELSDILMALMAPLTKLAFACESEIKLIEAQIEDEELYPRDIPRVNRLALIFFNKKA